MSDILRLSDKAKELVAAYDSEDQDSMFVLLDELKELGTEIAEPVVEALNEIQGRATIRKEKAKELTELAKKDEATIENMKKYLILMMEASGQDKMSVGAVNITKSKGKESVNIIDQNLVPDKYIKVSITVDGSQADAVIAAFPDAKLGKEEVNKTLVMEAHKAGVGVQGTEIVRNAYLLIRG